MKKLIFLLPIFILSMCQPARKPVAEMTETELVTYATELAQKFIIADGHVDLPYRMEVKGFMMKKQVEDVTQETEGNFDYPKAKRGGLDAPFMSIYVPSFYQDQGGAFEFADSLISMINQLADTYPDKFALAYTPKDIELNFKKGLISLPMGMENGAPIGNEIKNLSYFFDRGIRYITLTHSTDNQICDSSYDTKQTWGGLSPFGEEVVAEMNRLGIMVDVSHISDSAFYDVMRIVKAPVIASHSSVRKFTPGFQRNMDDEMIKLMASKGGVIHINFGSTFLSKEIQDKRSQMNEHLINWAKEKNLTRRDSAFQAYAKQYAIEIDAYSDVETVADHIDHVVELVGIDYVGFGSDYDGVGDSLPKGLKDVSGFPNLIAELLRRGYSEADIAKICYQNTFRVWNEVIRTAQELNK